MNCFRSSAHDHRSTRLRLHTLSGIHTALLALTLTLCFHAHTFTFCRFHDPLLLWIPFLIHCIQHLLPLSRSSPAATQGSLASLTLARSLSLAPNLSPQFSPSTPALPAVDPLSLFPPPLMPSSLACQPASLAPLPWRFTPERNPQEFNFLSNS